MSTNNKDIAPEPEVMLDDEVRRICDTLGLGSAGLATTLSTDYGNVAWWLERENYSDDLLKIRWQSKLGDSTEQGPYGCKHMRLLFNRIVFVKLNRLFDCLHKHLGSDEAFNKFLNKPWGEPEFYYLPSLTAIAKQNNAGKNKDNKLINGLEAVVAHLEEWLSTEMKDFCADTYWYSNHE